MRRSFVLPLVVVAVLAGCGSKEEASPSEGVSAEEIAAQSANLEGPRPGQYQVTTEIVEVAIPGMPAELSANIAKEMAAGTSITYCITEQDSAKAAREMAGKSGAGDCKFNTYEVSGNTINTEMVCAGPNGQNGTIRTSGTIGAEGMEVTADSEFPGMKMKTRVLTKRLGDCPA